MPVIVSQTGQLGTMASSRRFKKEIQPMNDASQSILMLKPVTFHYKSDKTNTPQFGLIAEEVAKVNPDLVVRDKEGKAYSVRYDQVNAMLLNEFLKEHRKVEEQQAAVAQLKSVVEEQQKQFQAAIVEQRKEFEMRLNQQNAKIEKVTAQLELNNPMTRTISNNR
jgi:predicted ribosome quality control (RQC) complex YloA/Tae2 family protein